MYFVWKKTTKKWQNSTKNLVYEKNIRVRIWYKSKSFPAENEKWKKMEKAHYTRVFVSTRVSYCTRASKKLRAVSTTNFHISWSFGRFQHREFFRLSWGWSHLAPVWSTPCVNGIIALMDSNLCDFCAHFGPNQQKKPSMRWVWLTRSHNFQRASQKFGKIFRKNIFMNRCSPKSVGDMWVVRQYKFWRAKILAAGHWVFLVIWSVICTHPPTHVVLWSK